MTPAKLKKLLRHGPAQSTMPGTEHYWVYARASGTLSTPVQDGGNDFLSDMVIHRMSKTGKWAQHPLSLIPKADQWGRYDLVVKAAGKARLFIRMIAFPFIPAYDGPCQGSLVPPHMQEMYDIDHLPRGPTLKASDKPDVRDCRLDRLRVCLRNTNRGLFFRRGWPKGTAVVRRKPAMWTHRMTMNKYHHALWLFSLLPLSLLPSLI